VTPFQLGYKKHFNTAQSSDNTVIVQQSGRKQVSEKLTSTI